MARHMMVVSSNPLAPTSAPAMMSRLLPSTNPAAAAARPENELSRAMTTGMSAPPIGMTSVTPAISATPMMAHIQKWPGLSARPAPSPKVRPTTARLNSRSAESVMAALESSSCNLANATMLPERVMAPIANVRAVATEPVAVCSSASRATTKAAAPTSTDAPPPNPLNSATSCGIPVISTRWASTAPMAAPSRRPSASSP